MKLLLSFDNMPGLFPLGCYLWLHTT